MISDNEKRFLIASLNDVSMGERVTDIEYTDSDLDNLIDFLDFGRDDISQIKRFFRYRGYDICSQCRKLDEECSCESPVIEDAYKLDPELVLEEWQETLVNIGGYEEVSLMSVDDSKWEVITSSSEFKNIEFIMISDTSRLQNHSGNLVERRFPVSFVETEWTAAGELRYVWHQLLDESTLETIHSNMRQAITPLNKNIFDPDSPVPSKNKRAIMNSLEDYLALSGFRQIDPQLEASNIGDVIKFSAIYYAAQKENKTILLCQCGASPSSLHLHYVVGGEIRPVSESKTAEKMAAKIQSRIGKLEVLKAKEQNLGGRARAFALAGAAISLGPIFTAIISLVGGDIIDLSSYQGIFNPLFALLLFFVVVLIVYPSIRLIMFRWDIRPVGKRLLAQFPNVL